MSVGTFKVLSFMRSWLCRLKVFERSVPPPGSKGERCIQKETNDNQGKARTIVLLFAEATPSTNRFANILVEERLPQVVFIYILKILYLRRSIVRSQ